MSPKETIHGHMHMRAQSLGWQGILRTVFGRYEIYRRTASVLGKFAVSDRDGSYEQRRSCGKEGYWRF